MATSDTVIRGCASPAVFQLTTRKKSVSTSKTNKDSGILLSLRWKTLHVTCAVIACASLIACLLISVLFDLESATTTDCQVQNYMPSISASTSLVPEQYIWRISIGLSIGWHYVFILVNYRFFSEHFTAQRKTRLYQIFVKCSAFVACMEKNGLVGLTFVSSSENHLFKIPSTVFLFTIPASHHKCFIVFMLSSLSYMLMYLVMIRWAHEWQSLTGKILKTYVHKRNTFLFNAGIFALAYYFYIRHHTYCERGVHSLFALCEYLVVLSNIYAHVIDGIYVFNDSEFHVTYSCGHGGWTDARADDRDK